MDVIKHLKENVPGHGDSFYIEETNNMNVLGVCVKSENKILINPTGIIEVAKEKGMSVKDFAVIIFFHEFGHYTDPDLNDIHEKQLKYSMLINNHKFRNDWFKKYAFYTYKAEENAWNIAYTYMKDEAKQMIRQVMKDSLMELKQTLKLQKELLKLNHKASLEF